MSSLILQTPSGWVPVQDPEAHTPGDYPNGNIAHIETLGDGTQVYICYWPDESPGDPVTELPIAGGKVITENDRTGALLRETDELFYQIRPLGNNPDGRATKQLQYPYAAGERQRQLESGRLYPASNSPFAIAVTHKEWAGQSNPTWDGWGWRAEFVVDPSGGTRNPGVRAIAIYSDEECTQYQFTTGAFVEGPSDWQMDEEGDPLTVWYTETPIGRATPTQEPVHHAVLYASLQEGHATMWPGDEGTLFNYWENDQIETDPPEVL